MHPDHLHKAAVIHLKIEHFLPMRGHHPSCGQRDDIQWWPQGLHDLPIHISSPWNKIWCIPHKALHLVIMHMPDSYSWHNLQVWWKWNELIVSNATMEIFVVLAIDIVKVNHLLCGVNLMLQRMDQSVIHIDLPIEQELDTFTIWFVDLLFPLLTVNHVMWNKAPMAGTCTTAYSSRCKRSLFNPGWDTLPQ